MTNYEFSDVRRCLYIACSNMEEVNFRGLFKKILQLTREHFCKNLLKINCSGPPRDILSIILEEGYQNSEGNQNSEQSVDVPVIDIASISNSHVNDHPISIPIIVSDEILSSHMRTNTSSTLKMRYTTCTYTCGNG